jgi:hypothetical protein
LFELAVPASGYAWWEYIEQLSGPGPFRGVDIQGRLFCLYQETKPGSNQRETVIEPNSFPGVIFTICKPKPVPRFASFDLGVAYRWTSHDTRFADSERIYMLMIQPAFSYNVFARNEDSDYLDVAFGAGLYRFHSSARDFDAFWGGYVEPLRLEFHPTTKFKRRYKKASALVPVLRVGYLLFPRGFDTTKFKAASPTQIGPDFVFKAGVFFDLEGFLYK